MHKILVDEKRWISENRFLHALNFCMLLPGPEAQQLVTYIGWLLHGWRGGLTAGILFVLPGFVSILGLSVLYAVHQELAWINALFFGLKAATLAVVLQAVLRIGKKALKNNSMRMIAGLSFLGIFVLQLPFPFIVLLAGAVGMLGGRMAPGRFCVIRGHEGSSADDAPVLNDHADNGLKPTWGRFLRVGPLCLTLWAAPQLALAAWLGPEHVLVDAGVFFSKAAVVTFGGAYAVLAYMAQQAVEVFGWLQPGEMLDGLGMAESTPGPLIQVVQYVGFMGAYRDPAPFSPLMAGMLASVLVTWVTFVPCFLWIFLGAPYIERLRGNHILSAGLSAITAAVVGVILNLAIWFSLNVSFATVHSHQWKGLRLLEPDWGSAIPASMLITLCAFVAMNRFKISMIPTLAVSALMGGVLAGLGWI